MDQNEQSWWARHRAKVYFAGGVLLTGALTLFLLSRTEETIEEGEADGEYDVPLDSSPEEVEDESGSGDNDEDGDAMVFVDED